MVQQSPHVYFDRQTSTRRSQATVSLISGMPLQPFPFDVLDTIKEDVAEPQPNLVHLDFSHLSSFERVGEQFATSGIVFHNTIALRPSNPSFLIGSEQTVLMGAPKSGLLDATFLRPAKFVTIALTGSRRTVVTGFDAAGAIVDKAEISEANLVSAHNNYQPNYPVYLQATDIHRMRLRSIGGQFTVSSMTFGY
ncbi:MAG: hypothetical protein AAGA75_21870 [Cyanobacteria bacterium P01_E01_bin.6]